jgi:hypothetical protein
VVVDVTDVVKVFQVGYEDRSVTRVQARNKEGSDDKSAGWEVEETMVSKG